MKKWLVAFALVAASVHPALAGEPLVDWISSGINVVYPADPDRLAALRAAMNAQNGTTLGPRGDAIIFYHAEMTNLRSETGLIGDGRAQTLWLIVQVNDPEGRGTNPACPDPAGGAARIRSCATVVPLQIITDSQALADHLVAQGHAGLVTVVQQFAVRSQASSGPEGALQDWKIDIEDPRVSLKLRAETRLSTSVETGATDGADFGSRPYPSDVVYGAEVTNQQFLVDPATFSLSVRRLDVSVSFNDQTFSLGDLFQPTGPPMVIRSDVRHMRLVKP